MDSNFDPQFLLEYTSWVRNLAQSLVFDPNRADDVVQEAWLAAIQRRRSELKNPRAWFASVIKSKAVDLLRSESRRKTREQRVAQDEAQENKEGELEDRVVFERKIYDAVLHLEEPYRSTVLLRFFEELSPAQIAKRQSIPLATVHTRLHRALAQLREKFDSEFGDRRAWCLALIPFALSRKTVAATAISGALIMSAKTKISIAVAVVLALSLGFWKLKGVFENPTQTARVENSHELSPQKSQELLAKQNEGEAASKERSEILVPSKTRQLEIEVLHADRQPASGATVLLFDGKEVIGKSCTNDKGISLLPPLEKEAQLIVGGITPFPVSKSLQAGTEKLSVTLNQGVSIEGKILVDGKIPEEPINLLLVSEETENQYSAQLVALPPFPQKAWKELLHSSMPALHAFQKTAADGSFRFSGLNPGWRGALHFTEGYEWDKAEAMFYTMSYVEAPTTNLMIHLTKLPALTARLVYKDGTPVIHAKIEGIIEFRKDESRYLNLETDENGRFVIYISQTYRERVPSDALQSLPRTITVVLVCYDSKENTQQQLLLKNIDVSRDTDLGNIQFVKSPSFPFVITDTQQQPIQNAIVFQIDDNALSTVFWPVRWKSPPSDAKGKTSFAYSSSSGQKTWVAAPRFLPKQISLPSQTDTETQVTLEPCTQLEIQLKTKAGTPLGELPVIVSSEQEIYSGYSEARQFSSWFQEHNNLRSLNQSHEIWDSTNIYYGFRKTVFFSDQSGKVILNCVRPNVDIYIEVNDRLGNLIENVVSVKLREGEHRVVNFPIEEKLANLKFRILDPDDKPVYGALINIQGLQTAMWTSKVMPEEDANYTGCQAASSVHNKNDLILTNVQGELEFHGIPLSQKLQLFVKKAGFAIKSIHGFELTEENQTLELKLQRACHFEIKLTDEKGNELNHLPNELCDYGYIFHNQEQITFENKNLYMGKWSFQDLPVDSITFKASFLGKVFEQSFHTGTENAQFVIPPLGSVSVHLTKSVQRDSRTLGVYLFLSPKNRATSREYQLTWGDTTQKSFSILPGDYELILKGYIVNKDEEELVSLTESKSFTVKANEATEVKLSVKK